MAKYARMYRWGIRPWERYPAAAAESIGRLLDRETAEHGTPPGRALDLGCGRGGYGPALAGRGWQVVGVDNVPRAIEEARRRDTSGVGYVVADVTDLVRAGLGSFDLFLDVGCFQGLDQRQRAAAGAGVTALAEPGATVLMLAFGPTRWRRLLEGVTPEEVAQAFPAWEVVAVEDADTRGLGWPMNRSRPRWYRLARRSVVASG
jgi:SAM-dependent methyltransferase